MPAKNHLTSEAKRKATKSSKREKKMGILEKEFYFLLLLNDGKTQQKELLEFVGCSKNKVCYARPWRPSTTT